MTNIQVSIQKWINGSRDYSEGLALFLQVSDNQKLKSFFLKWNTAHSISRLSEELERLYDPSAIQMEEVIKEQTQPDKGQDPPLVKWFNGSRDYSLGVALFCLLSDNDKLQKLLLKTETDHTRTRLVEQLERLYQQPCLQGVDFLKEKPRLTRIESNQDTLNPDLEASCNLKVDQLWQKLVTERAILFDCVKTADYGYNKIPAQAENLHKLALKVCELNYQFSEARNDLERVHIYGCLIESPSEEEIQQAAATELKASIDVMRDRIYRHKQYEQTFERLKIINKWVQKFKVLLEELRPGSTTTEDFLLTKWFIGSRNYSLGTALFCLLSENGKVQKSLLTGETNIKRTMLDEELELLYKQTGLRVVDFYPQETSYKQKEENLRSERITESASLLSLLEIADYDHDKNSLLLLETIHASCLKICQINQLISKPSDDLQEVQHQQVDQNQVIEETGIDLKAAIDNLRKNLHKLKQREQTPQRLALIQKHEENLTVLLKKWDKEKAMNKEIIAD